jgi:hypothetical protein
MLSLTYTKAGNLLLERWSANLLAYENQMRTMTNAHDKTDQGVKTCLNLWRGNERKLQPHTNHKYKNTVQDGHKIA